VETPLGLMPHYEDIDWTGLAMTREQFERLMSLDPLLWEQELASHGELFEKLKERLPHSLLARRETLQSELHKFTA
jgi:phosphoenolpyruvate carboxykinase (GTP)